MGSNLKVARVWQRLDQPGMESFFLDQEQNGWSLNGTIVTLQDGKPAAATYKILCSEAWVTQAADIELTIGSVHQRLMVKIENGVWIVNGKEIRTVRNCLDIDLGWTPSTNLLPIKRLNLAPGADSGIVVAGWVKFPELTIETLSQKYERLSSDWYRYSSRSGEFVAKIQVDAHGVALDYERFWKCVHD